MIAIKDGCLLLLKTVCESAGINFKKSGATDFVRWSTVCAKQRSYTYFSLKLFQVGPLRKQLNFGLSRTINYISNYGNNLTANLKTFQQDKCVFKMSTNRFCAVKYDNHAKRHLFLSYVSNMRNKNCTAYPLSTVVFREFQTTANKQNLPKVKTAGKEGVQKDIKLSTKRTIRRKRSQNSTPRSPEIFDITAYATCEELDLESLHKDLKKDGLYVSMQLPKDCEDAIHVEAVYKVEDECREILLFREGAVVFWNVPEIERNLVLRKMKKHQENSFDPELVLAEQENVQYMFTDSKTALVGDDINLKIPNTPEELILHQLEKYTFSNVLVLSVKLAMWEASLETYIESIEYILEDLKAGKKLKISKGEVLRKTGELLTLRHLINLSSDLLDIPDFYWNRDEQLEILYRGIQKQLNMMRRVRVMNEKLNHCCELMELLREQLNDKHHIKLEWLIIFLITVEVVFEILRVAGLSH